MDNSNQASLLIDLEQKFGPKVYSTRNILFTHGKDAILYDSEGNDYIDLTSGHGVANICTSDLERNEGDIVVCGGVAVEF